MNETKRCSRCKVERPVEEFARIKHYRDGLDCWCKGCRKGYRKGRKANTPEDLAARQADQKAEKNRQEAEARGNEVCSRCGKEQPLSEFAKDPRGKDGRSPRCRSCTRAYARAWIHTQTGKEARARYQQTPKYQESMKRSRGKWQDANPGKMAESRRKWQLRKKFDLGVDEFNRMVAARGGNCDCCGKKVQGTMHVDHDHSAPDNPIRGLLCKQCNTGIGLLGDDVAGLERALAYLRRTSVPT